MSPAPASGWARPEDIQAKLRARWERGVYLRARAVGEAWEPVRVRLAGPSAQDLLERTADSLAWIDAIRSWAAGGRAGPVCQVEDRVVRSRALGVNQVPGFVVVDSIEDLSRLVGHVGDVAAFDRVLSTTADRCVALVDWVAAHPAAVLEVAGEWDLLLDVVAWIDQHDTSRYHLRHLDLPGVDTKFVERHRKLLGHLLAVVLPAERIDQRAARFDARFGFKTVPGYLRFRLLSPLAELPAALSELSVRTDELALLPLPVRTVFVVENQATYLAFPEVPDAIVVFGEGFKASALEAVSWLGERDLVYWGDIDTHGFRILDQLRARVPTVRSILMDEATLFAHLDRVVCEDSPTDAVLEHLTPPEVRLYRDLVEDRFGHAVRLEQERVRFGTVREALEPWLNPPHGRS